MQTLRTFTTAEHDTWSRLFTGLNFSRTDQAHPLFTQGVESLGISSDHIPDLRAVNARLYARSGWTGIPAEGLVNNRDFFQGLALKQFPLGNFIRQPEDISYTPAPDIFHDLYGHLPLLADPAFADFCQRLGTAALPYLDNESLLGQFGRLFWFGVEFPLIRFENKTRIFGGGILSSKGECDYCLGPEVEVVPFNIEEIRRRRYHIDDFQTRIYKLDSPEELYNCLDTFVAGLKVLNPNEECEIVRRKALESRP